MQFIATSVFPGIDDWNLVVRLSIRLFVATVIGVCIGIERARQHKDAGLRTHALVSLGAALFTATAVEAGMSNADLSRVMQGIAAGIGFLGAGTILKQAGELKTPGNHRIEGLTTAASIWLTAAAGMAVGAGWVWPPVITMILALLVLTFGHSIEHWVRGDEDAHDEPRA